MAALYIRSKRGKIGINNMKKRTLFEARRERKIHSRPCPVFADSITTNLQTL
jgi:hypothetical protein